MDKREELERMERALARIEAAIKALDAVQRRLNESLIQDWANAKNSMYPGA